MKQNLVELSKATYHKWVPRVSHLCAARHTHLTVIGWIFYSLLREGAKEADILFVVLAILCEIRES